MSGYDVSGPIRPHRFTGEQRRNIHRQENFIRWPHGEVQDVVDAVLYLESGSSVTGEILHVDGGRSAGH
jgi:enoyl-[acyl-carrier-protein] reductase (NADH)